MKRYIASALGSLLSAAAVISLNACADYVDVEDVEGKPIRFVAGRAFDPTRAATDIQGPVFEAGEKVNVFIKGTSSTQTDAVAIGDYPTEFTTSAAVNDKNELTPPSGETPHYLIGSSSEITVTAAYPNTVVSTTTDFTVKYDQTSDDDYKASDLMLVKPVTHSKSDEIINLPFQHKMAKLIISAIGDPGITMDGTLTIGSTTDAGKGTGVFRTVDISVENGDYAAPLNYTSNANLSNKGSIVMSNGGAVLIPPQTVTTADFIVVTGHTNADPTTRKCRFAIIDKKFEAGKTYKLTLAISEDNFTTPETITGWTNDYGELTLMPSGGYKGVSIDAIEAVTYSGDYFTPKPTVWYGTSDQIQLREGATKDFIYNYVDNKNAGNAQVLVIGQNYYAGLAAVQGFTIQKAPGKVFFPEGTVRDGDDHTGIEFELNKSLDAIKAQNTALSNTTKKADGEITYSAEGDTPESSTDVISVDPIDGTVVIQNIGIAYVRATTPSGLISGQNYYYTDGTGDTQVNNTDRYKVVVKAKPATETTLHVSFDTGNTIVSDDDSATGKETNQYFVYNGQAQQLASLTVSDGEFTLAQGTDYDYTLTNNKDRGNAALTIKGKKNYNAEFTVNIPICQAQPKITVDETGLTMGIHQNTAPKSRRKTRVATTESWASANLRYSLSSSSDGYSYDETNKIYSNDVLSVNQKGVITGLSAGTTTIYVDVDADGSDNQNWKAAAQKSFDVTVVNSDFTFELERDANGKLVTLSGTNPWNKGVPKGGHSIWVCPASGLWQIDCYGAQGASTPVSWKNSAGTATVTAVNRGMGGRGAHIAGRIYLKEGQVLHVVVGEQGRNFLPGEIRNTTQVEGGKYELSCIAWNGGGGFVWGAYRNSSNVYNTTYGVATFPTSGGGGATDVSLSFGTYAGGTNMVRREGQTSTTSVDSLAWKSPAHLYSRIIVAGGGGGALYYDSAGDGKGFGDGGDGGGSLSNWKGLNGLFNDYGQGGELDRGGYGGIISNWRIGTSTGTNGSFIMNHERASVYDDGPYGGGYSCYDGMFGEGGSYTFQTQGDGCGGGGWYGGGAAGEYAANGSGAGGSSFLWTDDDEMIVNGMRLYEYYSKRSDLYSVDNTYFSAPSDKYPSYIPSTDSSSSNYIPFFSEVVTADAGARAGDGKAMITAVELDDVCVSK